VDALGAREGCMFVFARALCAGTRRVLADEGRDDRLLFLLLRLVGAGSLPCGWPGRGGGAREAVAGFRRGGLRARDGGREEGGGIVARWRAWAAALLRFGAEEGRGGGGMSWDWTLGDCVGDASCAFGSCPFRCVA